MDRASSEEHVSPTPVTVMDARTLPQVRMPNREGFVLDPQPDVGRASRRPSALRQR